MNGFPVNATGDFLTETDLKRQAAARTGQGTYPSVGNAMDNAATRTFTPSVDNAINNAGTGNFTSAVKNAINQAATTNFNTFGNNWMGGRGDAGMIGGHGDAGMLGGRGDAGMLGGRGPSSWIGGHGNEQPNPLAPAIPSAQVLTVPQANTEEEPVVPQQEEPVVDLSYLDAPSRPTALDKLRAEGPQGLSLADMIRRLRESPYGTMG